MEVFYFLVLVSRSARWIVPTLIVIAHVSIFALQRILFFDLILLQLAFFDFGAIRRSVAGWIAARRRRIEVLYDGPGEGERSGNTARRCLADTDAHALRARVPYTLIASVLIMTSVVCWIHRVEFYPLTAWHLYAMLELSGTVNYPRVLGRHESGITSPVRLEDGIGALALDGRYIPVLDKCFGDTEDVAMCRKVLTTIGAAYNAKTPPGSRLTQLEVQEWTWDFLSSPFDPELGDLHNSVVIDISGGHERPAVVETRFQRR